MRKLSEINKPKGIVLFCVLLCILAGCSGPSVISQANSKKECIREIDIQQQIDVEQACRIKKATIKDSLLLIWPADSAKKSYKLVGNGKYLKTFPPKTTLSLICIKGRKNKQHPFPLKYQLKTLQFRGSNKITIALTKYDKLLIYEY